MASSTGGIAALRLILSSLQHDFPLPVLIVQHTSPDDGNSLCDVLASVCPLPVVPGSARLRVAPGTVYVAPPAYHLLVEKGPRLALSVDQRVCYVRPSADVLFESAADVWGAGLIGVILTGANHDGANGLMAVRARKGLAIVQLPEEAEMPVMPRTALELAGADHVLRLAEIGPFLNSSFSG